MWTSLVAQLVKNLPAMQETWVWSLGWEDPLEKGTATHSSIWPEEFHGVESIVSQRVGHRGVTFTFTFILTCIYYYDNIQNIFTVLKILCSTYSPSEPNHCSFLLSLWVCPFKNVIKNHIEHSLFKLASFYCNIHLSFLHTFSWLFIAHFKALNNSFLKNLWLIFHCLDVPHLIHLPTERHIGFFQVLAIMNKAAINILVQIFV